ncbi:MAG TPA: condensation domain-containing protein, partial [Thermoanaerobaculia bacterium]|nr:condensation domain-containing protein [Thermoanaerobaculia bacterium]
PTEEALAEIWCEVLGRERIGVHDNFFELGGHSLLATQVVSRVRETLRRELPLRGLFAAPTVAALAERLEDEARPSAPPILRASRKWDLPLSFSQQRLWYLDQLQPGSPTYHIPAAVRLRGRLEAPVLEAALRQLVARQESLRTRFLTAEGRPVQVVVPEVPVALPRVDLTGVPEAQSEDLVRELASVLFLQPFDLRKAPLLRPALLRLSDTEHALVVVFHHIVVDGWSLAVFFRELSVLYRALAGRRRPDLPPLAIQYADFAVWQREWVENAVLVSQLPYWKERLGVRPARLELPTDRTRPTMASFRGARRQVALGRALTSRLKDLSAGRRATLFMTLVAGFKTLLHRLTEQTDIVIGTAIANRNRREIEGLVGMFFNLLALRTDLGGNPAFDELIERVREVALGAYAHQDLPFEKLLEELQPEREMSRTPLFQVTAVLQNAPLSSIELPDLCLEPFPVESGTANFELNLQMTEGPDGLVGILEYRTDLFDGVTIARLGEHWVRLLEGAVEDPRRRLLDLPLLSDGERAQLIREWNDTSGTFPADVLMHELFETQAERSPERVAVLCAGQEWSYGELDARADRLARYLRSLGVGPGSLVGVHLSRSAEMVLALLGVLKAGGAYVPLETSYPEARLHWIVERLGIRQVLTQHRHTARLLELGPLPELRTLVCLDEESNKDDTDPRVVAWSELAALPAGPPERLGDPDDPAYIIFTSGSTGSPKGVLVRHRPAVNLIDWVNGRFA